MRRVVLVVVLVAASFLGGAFVNGPGLRWVQTQLLGSLGLSEGGEIALIDLKGAESPDAAPDRARPAKPGPETIRGPLAPVPSLVAEAETGKQDPRDRRSRPTRPAGSAGPGRPALPVSPPPLTAPLSSRVAPGSDPSGPAAVVTSPPAPLDPSVMPSTAASAPAGGTASQAVGDRGRDARATTGVQAPSDQNVTPALLESLTSLMPPTAPPSPADSPLPALGAGLPTPPTATQSSPPSHPQPEPQPGTAGGEEWAALGRRMQALGVSRFTIEGQAGGRVVFSCLIPLAGRQAVAQRFEAEGEDGFQAAQAALRRVALWRATQRQ